MSRSQFLISTLIIILISISVGNAQVTDPRYHTTVEIADELHTYAALYPDICQLDTLGYTGVDNLPLYALKISDNVHLDEDEPVVFYLGTLHAEEVLGVEVAMFMIDSLLTAYAVNPQVQTWVDHCEIWIMPDANPEGHNVVMDGQDIYYRKNKRDNNDNGTFLENTDYNPDLNPSTAIGEGWDDFDGVDLNRNWDFHWEESPDDSPTWDANSGNYYRGPYPFSEPETAAMRDLIHEQDVGLALFMHSSRRGDPDSPFVSGGGLTKVDKRERFFYPWTYGNGWTDLSPDYFAIMDIVAAMALEIEREVDEPGNPDCYRCDLERYSPRGVARDYVYARDGVYAATVEIGYWIQPPGDFIDPFCRKIMNSVTYLLDRPFFAGITGHVTDALTGVPLEAEIEIVEITDPQNRLDPRLSEPVFGRFTRYLKASGEQNYIVQACHKRNPSDPISLGFAPATYTLQVSKDGYETQTIPGLVVSNEVLTEVDVALVPTAVQFMTGFPVETPPIIQSAVVYHDLNHDGRDDMIVVDSAGYVHVLSYHGQELPGWPQSIETGENPQSVSAASGDVDGDGEFEVVAASVEETGLVSIWNPDGSLQHTFPIVTPPSRELDNTATISLYNLDADADLEVILNHNGSLTGFDIDGTLLTEWDPGVLFNEISIPTMTDINRDGLPEIIVTVDAAPGGGLYVLTGDNPPLPGFPITEFGHSTVPPVVANVDADEELEIFAILGGQLYGFDPDGSVLTGFPVMLNQGMTCTALALGNLDRSGAVEIVVGVKEPGLLYAFSAEGSLANGFPYDAGEAITSPPIIAEVSGSIMPEILFTTETGAWHVVDVTGNAVEGFPVRLSTGTITNPLAVGDFDHDSAVELVVALDEGGIYALELNHFFVEDLMEWPMFQHDAYHSGAYNFYDVVRVADDAVPEVAFGLSAPYPNPSRDGTQIRFSLPQAGPCELRVFNIAGQLVKTLLNNNLPTGTHDLTWDGTNERQEEASSGVYLFQLSHQQRQTQQRFILVR